MSNSSSPRSVWSFIIKVIITVATAIGATTVENIPTYDLFLRVAKVADGTGSAASSIGEVRAFNIKSVLESVNSSEANKGSTKFNLKVNYLNTINEKDSTDLKWSSYTVQFLVEKNS